MGKKRKRRDCSPDSSQDEDSEVESLLSSPSKAGRKLGKWAAKGKARRLSRLLSRASTTACKQLLRARDSYGLTPLHNACAHGHTEAVLALLQCGADTEARDEGGNTPAHLAASNRHMDVVTALLTCSHPPDIDIANDGGVTIAALVDKALGHAPARGQQLLAHGGDGRQGEVEIDDEDEEARWQRKLREEASDEEWAAGRAGVGGEDEEEEVVFGWWHQGGGARAGSHQETEDEWADRMWAEMAARRRAAAAEQARAFGIASAQARAAAEAEARARAESAAKESERILREERARDAEWRRRALPAPEGNVASDLPTADPAAAWQQYTAAWAALEARLAHAKNGERLSLRLEELAWPLPPQYGLQHYNKSVLQDILLCDVQGPDDIKRRVRSELLRWHPDKWKQRIGVHVVAQHAEQASQRAHAISQVLTQLVN